MPNSTAITSDCHLLSAWTQRRDQMAFRTLVEKYSGLVFGTALRKSGRSDWAEDVVQEVFIVFARRAPQLRGAGELAGWLHQTALNKTRHRMRTESRHDTRMKKLAAQFTEAPVPSPSDEEWTALLPVLDEAIASLGEKDRQIILCHYFQQKTFSEVAIMTGLTPDAVRKRAQRVLVKLSDKLRRKTCRPAEAAVAGILTAAGSQAAPAGLAAKTSVAALTAAGASTGAGVLSAIFLFPAIAMKASTLVFLALSVATAGGLTWRFWPREIGKTAEQGALVRAVPPKAKRAIVAPAPRDPRPIALPAPAKPAPRIVTERDHPDYQYKDAFQNHPRTKLAEKRITAFKFGIREIMLRRVRHPELVDLHNKAFTRARDQSLSAAERAAAELEVADLNARIDQDRSESGLKEFTEEWNEWLNAEVLAERASILNEVKRNDGKIPEPADPDTLTTNQSSPGPLAPDPPWRRMLDAMIAGDRDATESASSEMLRDTASAGCFAMAAAAISRDLWDDAQIWVDQAWKHGTPEENAAYGEVLTGLGWMQQDAKQLIRPEEETSWELSKTP